MPSTQFILQVARSFPLLEEKLGVYNPKQFDPKVLLRLSKGCSTSEIHLCNFVLTAWDRNWAKDHKCLFDVFGALSCFDGDNRETLIRWISTPGFPGRFL